MDRIPSSISILRVVEIEDIDLCPCGGTHVSNFTNSNDIKFVGSKGIRKLRITYNLINYFHRRKLLVGSAGIEPAIFAMSRRRHNP